MRFQRVQHVQQPVVDLRLDPAMLLIIRAIRLQRLCNILLARSLRHSAADLHLRPVADKAAHFLQASLGVAHLAQHMVRAVAQVLERVEQRAVHIKKGRLICHHSFLFFRFLYFSALL